MRARVEPLVHVPEAVQPARIGRIGVVDYAVLKRNALMPGRSRVYLSTSVPAMTALSATSCGTTVV